MTLHQNRPAHTTSLMDVGPSLHVNQLPYGVAIVLLVVHTALHPHILAEC